MNESEVPSSIRNARQHKTGRGSSLITEIERGREREREREREKIEREGGRENSNGGAVDPNPTGGTVKQAPISIPSRDA